MSRSADAKAQAPLASEPAPARGGHRPRFQGLSPNLGATFNYRLRQPAKPASIADWREAARRALPEMIWAYVEDGADARRTRDENIAAFDDHHLRQRALAGCKAPVLTKSFCGERLSMPVALAPTGMTGLSHWSGDIACARAAEAAGTRYVVSTAASYTVEEIAAATQENHWFQLYCFGDRATVGGLMRRAQAAGYTTLFLTVDTPVRGNRESEVRTGMTVPPTLTPGTAWDFLRHPRWTWGALAHRRTSPIHYAELGREQSGASELERAALAQARLMQDDLDWDDLAWMRDTWRGKLYVKGVLDPDDAARAVHAVGADGVVVSNHGGRQLDHALATLRALPAIRAAVGDRGEVLLDGGVRRGTDIVKALCLGADGVFVGRPYVYGLAAAGEQGVREVLALLRADLARTLTLMGCPDVAQLDRSWLL
jgi:L-lactate dehydrogenase (cytochrome)/(S)-mandelate dehydrogenase